ncbi:aminotransferase class I/II-fold pyridoxal phosphate-dependent enzyme [Maribacter sp. 2307ULW6-5]|uniref:aminotransferase class I/II-fold pyridoxal phosphate-dependent enzyme n=1 Tax=Maribacter sp. 2307ULW6-5 TaxID=3386275 RepID=UPI0039BCCF1E
MEAREASLGSRTLGNTSGLVDFSSNDYLGFARNETLFSKTFQLLLSANIAHNGATGSRLVSGNHPLYADLELLLAQFHRAESALVFNSGYDANIGFFGAVPQRNDVVLHDAHVHASIRDGMAMGRAKCVKFEHNDLLDLQKKHAGLKDALHGDSTVYVVTEAVFSMDGDTPDLAALAAFCKDTGALLVVDEAHAVGVLGQRGEGLVPSLGLEDEVFARTVTFGKALGAHGAAVLGSKALVQYLVNFARSFIYTTALAPHTLATILAAYQHLQAEGAKEMFCLRENMDFFEQKMAAEKLTHHFVGSSSAIRACLVPGNAKVLKLSGMLRDQGFDVKAMRAPTVPEGSERLRFCLHSTNGKEEIGLVLQLLSKFL